MSHPFVFPEQVWSGKMIGLLVRLRQAPGKRHERFVRRARKRAGIHERHPRIETDLEVLARICDADNLLQQRAFGETVLHHLGVPESFHEVVGIGIVVHWRLLAKSELIYLTFFKQPSIKSPSPSVRS